MTSNALMTFVQSMRSWQKPNAEPGVSLSPVLASPPVGVLLGGETGGRMISEIHSTGPKPEAPSAELDIHSLPEHWKDDTHEATGTEVAHLEIAEAVIASRQVLPSDLVDGPIHFTVGPNVGAQILSAPGPPARRRKNCFSH